MSEHKTVIYLDDEISLIHEGNVYSVSEHGQEISSYDAIVVLPGEKFSNFTVDISTRNQANFLKALPFALEDKLLEDADAVHFTPGAKFPGGSRQVFAVSHDNMRLWLEQLTGLKIKPRIMIPETALFADFAAEDSTVVWLLPAKAVISNGFELSAISFANLDMILSAIDLQDNVKVIRFTDSPDIPVGNYRLLTRNEKYLEFLTANINQVQNINCAHGSYKFASADASYGKVAAIAALVVFLLLGKIVSAWIDNVKLDNELAGIKQEINAVFKRVFPDAKVVNPRVQMEQKLKRYAGFPGGKSRSMRLLSDVGEIISHNQDLELASLVIDSNGIKFQLKSKSLVIMESFANEVKAGFARAELLSATGSGDSFSGILYIPLQLAK